MLSAILLRMTAMTARKTILDFGLGILDWDAFFRGIQNLVLLTLLIVPVAMGQPAADTLAVPGLHAPVEMLTDAWGIAHIYAENEHDLFFAQGYNAARDRLFQLEIWRRQATGTVAEILGARELERDIGTRLFLFRGDMTQEMNYYHPRGVEIITAFVEGVNAVMISTPRGWK